MLGDCPCVSMTTYQIGTKTYTIVKRNVWYVTWRFSSSVPEDTISFTLLEIWSYTAYTELDVEPLAPLLLGDPYQQVIRHVHSKPL